MSFSVEYLEDRDIVMARVVDRISLEDARPLIMEQLRVSRERNCKRFIIDVAGADVELTTLDLFRLADLYEEVEFPRSAKKAIVWPGSDGDGQFYEHALQLRGWNVCLFDEVEDAMSWLGKT